VAAALEPGPTGFKRLTPQHHLARRPAPVPAKPHRIVFDTCIWPMMTPRVWRGAPSPPSRDRPRPWSAHPGLERARFFNAPAPAGWTRAQAQSRWVVRASRRGAKRPTARQFFRGDARRAFCSTRPADNILLGMERAVTEGAVEAALKRCPMSPSFPQAAKRLDSAAGRAVGPVRRAAL